MENKDWGSLKLVIITGLSGSGKSTVSRVLEDMGFFCIDNLPIALLPQLFELRSTSLRDYGKIALVMDLREKEFVKTYPQIFDWLRAQNLDLEILFLEATDEVLVKRYSQTRRAHPLAEGGSITEGIRKERTMLEGLRARATIVIDTSTYNVHQLQRTIREIFGSKVGGRRMNITFLSFGYSRGIPPEADLVIDVRFLPNPFFEEELQDLPGTDARIKDYLLQFAETREFLHNLQQFLEYLFPFYEKEGKPYLTVAIGCTGGRHRSVAIAEKMVEVFSARFPVRKRHRDLEVVH
jgi:UPF0042 nucleotide-binding protein